MAGDWIKIEHATVDKPEVVRLAQALQLDQDAVVGKLLRLWVWADEQTVNGNDLGVSNAFIDRLTFCPGFAAGLVKVGWLDGREGRLSIPNFDRHNGQTAKARAVEQKKKQSQRRKKSDVPENEGQKRDNIGTREEKRREEKISLSISWVAEGVKVPEEFQTDQFGIAWKRWKKHMLELHKDVSSITEETELMDLVSRGYGHDEAIEVIKFSIEKGAKSLIKNGSHKLESAPKQQSLPYVQRHKPIGVKIVP